LKSAPIAVGGIAALLAGACCFGPLVLVSLGIGGAWLANFQVLEPYRPFFIAIALVALGFAWKLVYRPQADCAPGEACAVPAVHRGYKIGFWIAAALLLVMLTFPYFARYLY
jgi:mercuric ion transport protein